MYLLWLLFFGQLQKSVVGNTSYIFLRIVISTTRNGLICLRSTTGDLREKYFVTSQFSWVVPHGPLTRTRKGEERYLGKPHKLLDLCNSGSARCLPDPYSASKQLQSSWQSISPTASTWETSLPLPFLARLYRCYLNPAHVLPPRIKYV